MRGRRLVKPAPDVRIGQGTPGMRAPALRCARCLAREDRGHVPTPIYRGDQLPMAPTPTGGLLVRLSDAKHFRRFRTSRQRVRPLRSSGVDAGCAAARQAGAGRRGRGKRY
jgi:hypothetical protein